MFFAFVGLCYQQFFVQFDSSEASL
jgi:hypothetical protein